MAPPLFVRVSRSGGPAGYAGEPGSGGPEQALCGCSDALAPCVGEAGAGQVAVGGVEVDAGKGAAELPGGDAGGATAHERVQHLATGAAAGGNRLEWDV